MIDWPSVLAMCSPTNRATISVVPPGANGTMSVMLRSGYSAAMACEHARMASTPMRRVREDVFRAGIVEPPKWFILGGRATTEKQLAQAYELRWLHSLGHRGGIALGD